MMDPKEIFPDHGPPDRAEAERGQREILRAWGLEPVADELRLHLDLIYRTVHPDEKTLRLAASWLSKLLHHARRKGEPEIFLAPLAEKSALVLRLARRHVPQLADELERPHSDLHAIEAAARFAPTPSAAAPLHALRSTIAQIHLPDHPPAGEDPEWHENRQRLHDLILHDNPNRFLSWPVIVNSMFMSDAKIAGVELEALNAQADYAARWSPALREDAMGAPMRTHLHPQSSTNLIHHAYNLLHLETNTPARIEQLSTILEFGGGYGSTARLAFRLGFRGQYIIFDLPEFSALQRFYLSSLGFPAQPQSQATEHGAPAIHLTSSLEQLQQLLPAKGPDLFLATWSFSESPQAIRNQLLPYLLSAKRLLIGYQSHFGKIDNMEYFASLPLPHRTIHNYPIPHLRNNHYLVASDIV